MVALKTVLSFFFFNDRATTEIYTLSLHDALPILQALRLEPPRVPLQDLVELLQKRELLKLREPERHLVPGPGQRGEEPLRERAGPLARQARSEEHTSELQSQFHLVCRLLLEKKKK